MRWERVDPDVLSALGEKITTLSAELARSTNRLLALIEELDRPEGWKREGFASCAEWLACRTRLDRKRAGEKVRVARALAGLPQTSAAMARGELSFSQVRALVMRAISDRGGERRALPRERPGDHARAAARGRARAPGGAGARGGVRRRRRRGLRG